ncbi:MAG: hypothetical protein HY867_09975 [Chloroflexi bacterium]|nr:hypothetical protein [Chloroflexota bacterium]
MPTRSRRSILSICLLLGALAVIVVSSVQQAQAAPLNTDNVFEGRVRYILADAQLGNVIGYYRGQTGDAAAVEAVSRWDAYIRAENISSFERKTVGGTWQVVYAGTNTTINGLDVILTKDEGRIRYIMADIKLGSVLAYYKNAAATDIVADRAVKRWQQGIRPANISLFERKIVSGYWQVVYKGTDTSIDPLDVLLTSDNVYLTTFNETFTADIFRSPTWFRSDASVYVANGKMQFKSNGNYDSKAVMYRKFNLPVTVIMRANVVLGGENYTFPGLALHYANGGRKIVITCLADQGWAFGSAFSGIHTKCPASENTWLTIKAVIRSNGGDLYAKFDGEATFTKVMSSVWTINGPLTHFRIGQPWDARVAVDYIRFTAAP